MSSGRVARASSGRSAIRGDRPVRLAMVAPNLTIV